jgi:hypothetical protein
MRARFAALAAVALLVAGSSANAQQGACPNNAPICVGPDGRVIIGGRVQSPNVPVDPNIDARARAEAQARADADLRARLAVERWLEWKAYLDWLARIRIDAEARASARLRADASARASASWDRWASTPIPALGPHPDRIVSYPRESLGILPPCVAVFTSSRRALPAYGGVCLPFRHRFDDTWSLGVDTSYVFERYASAHWTSLGLHPNVRYSFAHGRGDGTASDAYLRAGVDGQVPLAGGHASPDTYVGGHVGLGVHANSGWAGIGMELRGLARGGTSSAVNGAARLRFGAEFRFTLLTVNW